MHTTQTKTQTNSNSQWQWMAANNYSGGRNLNEVNETIRAIDASIGHHKKKIRELNDAKKEIMDKYNIPYNKEED